jgi:hypothetical protein
MVVVTARKKELADDFTARFAALPLERQVEVLLDIARFFGREAVEPRLPRPPARRRRTSKGLVRCHV